MRKRLTYNYWLMIVAWCMFLNGYNLLANMFGLAACAVLSTINKRINHWRMCLVGLFIYFTISLFLLNSNITYFFPKLSLFIVTICINSSLTYEYLYLLKSKFIVPYVLAMILAVSVLSIITMILPNDLYSIFSKKSLFIMESLIFLPYLMTSSFVLLLRRIHCQNTRSIIKRKAATM